jgi:uncharacterized protein
MKKLVGAIGLSCLFATGSAHAQATDFLELVKTETAQSVQVSIDQGQDVNVKSDFGETPLMLAAESNPDPDVIIVLRRAGADPNALDKFGLTPLMHVARVNPNPAAVAALLDAGAEINAQINGMTALMYAAQRNPNPRVIIMLLDAGADVRARDLAGNTAFDYAQHNEKLKSTDAFNKLRGAPTAEHGARPVAAWPAYVLCLFPGYGLGHLYCGDAAGGLFLIGDIVGPAILLLGAASSSASSDFPIALGLIILMVTRTWEISDIGKAVDRAKGAGRVADVVPRIDVAIQRTSFELGVSLKY